MKCQPVRGDGNLVDTDYTSLGKRDDFELPNPKNLGIATQILKTAFVLPCAHEPSKRHLHAALLSSVLALAKPRRFVELGAHSGMRFLAACNTANLLNLETQCVAIDTWVDSVHTDRHDQIAFERFRDNLASLFPNQHYIRGRFEDAAECFEDGSIDLLRIDHLHTYEAVKTNFETWLPKMSDAGLVLFGDVKAYQSDAGVWRFWKEIEQRYSSNVFHSHGIAYVGGRKAKLADRDMAMLVHAGLRGLERTRPFRKMTNRIRKICRRPQKIWPDLAPS
jgi:hypothetical protein